MRQAREKMHQAHSCAKVKQTCGPGNKAMSSAHRDIMEASLCENCEYEGHYCLLIKHNHTARLTLVKSERLKISEHRICGTVREIGLQ